MSPFTEVEELLDTELMGYKEDLQTVNQKLDKVLGRIQNIEKTQSEKPRYNPQKHGNFAQWASVIIAAVALVLSIVISGSSKRKVDVLAQQVSYIQGKLGIQEVLSQFTDPGQVTRGITGQIEQATVKNTPLPAQELASYRLALRSLPKSTQDYWTTLASIVNYASHQNQLQGVAPDPESVSRPCLNTTAHDIVMSHMRFENCYVNLDNEALDSSTFINSVVRYRGGEATLSNIVFINCRFIVDIPKGTNPGQQKLLIALLDSPDQKTVKVNGL